jgi:hypothetical protein
LTEDEFKGKKFVWSDYCEESFKKMKDIFTSATNLYSYEHKLPKVIEINIRDFAINTILLQIKDGRLQPITFNK